LVSSNHVISIHFDADCLLLILLNQSESEKEEDGEVEMEEVIDVVRDSEIPLSYAKDGIFNPTQVLRSGKQVFSELRATTIEKGEFEVRF